MQVGVLMGQMGGDILADGSATGKFMCGQAVTEVTITAINQPRFKPANGMVGEVIPAQGFLYGDFDSITITGKMMLFNSGR